MLRRYLGATISIAILAILVILAGGCSPDNPTEVATEASSRDLLLDPPPLEKSGVTHVISTNEALRGIFDPTTSPLGDGDVVWLESGDYEFWSKNVCYWSGAISFVFEGDPAAPPVVRRRGGGGVQQPFLRFEDTAGGGHQIQIKNIEFEIEVGMIALEILNFQYVLLDHVSVAGSSISTTYVASSFLMVNGCEFNGMGWMLLHTGLDGGVGQHYVTNNTFNITEPMAGAPAVAGSHGGGVATFTYDTNVFTSVGGLNEDAIYSFADDSPNFTVKLWNNDLGNMRIQVGETGSYSQLNADGNASTFAACVEDVIVQPAGQEMDLVDIDTWIYGDQLYSYEDFGAIADRDAHHYFVYDPVHQVTTDYVCVQFTVPLGTGNDNLDLVDVVVKYGPSGCAAETVEACFNAETGKWNARLDVTGYGTQYHWRPVATLCGQVREGTCDQGHFRPGWGLQIPPLWYGCD